jgi:alkylated DNA nucleotide flippase Atl1
MAKPKKSWREKLNDSKDLPKVITLTQRQAKLWGHGTMAIAPPLEINDIMKRVPKGKLITINEIRKIIAAKHNADIGCPITTGIFAWISAYAAEEDKAAGKKRITPYWRTLKKGGEINMKYPGGIAAQIKLLESEGFDILPKGSKAFVTGFEKYLVKNI